MPTPPEVFKQHEEWIRKMAAGLISKNSKLDRDDFAQETVIECLKMCYISVMTQRPIVHPKAYFRAVAQKYLITFLRSHRRFDLIVSLEDIEFEIEDTSSYSNVSLDLTIEDVLDNISNNPSNREFWKLILSDKTHQEIGELLGISANASRARLHRERKRVKDLGIFDDLRNFGGEPA